DRSMKETQTPDRMASQEPRSGSGNGVLAKSPSSLAEISLPPGFRSKPRTLSDAEIEAMNEERRWFGEPPFEPAVVALEQIPREQRPSLEQLKAWAMHPDERVPVALLDHLKLGRRAWIAALPIVGRLVERALE